MSADGEHSFSTHVLDTERGEPAAGVPVTLSRWDHDELVTLATHETDRDGRIQDLAAGTLRGGAYQVAFDVAAYFRKQGRDAPFLTRVVIDFQVPDPGRHYHVPLLLSPFACTSYRGS
jgi:5-hydroxyisourate hydrolase